MISNGRFFTLLAVLPLLATASPTHTTTTSDASDGSNELPLTFGVDLNSGDGGAVKGADSDFGEEVVVKPAAGDHDGSSKVVAAPDCRNDPAFIEAVAKEIIHQQQLQWYKQYQKQQQVLVAIRSGRPRPIPTLPQTPSRSFVQPASRSNKNNAASQLASPPSGSSNDTDRAASAEGEAATNVTCVSGNCTTDGESRMMWSANQPAGYYPANRQAYPPYQQPSYDGGFYPMYPVPRTAPPTTTLHNWVSKSRGAGETGKEAVVHAAQSVGGFFSGLFGKK